MEDTLERLAAVIESRRTRSPEASYVASLYERGLDHILEKIGEEASELIIAAKGGSACDVVYETADLWFHTLVLLAEHGLRPADVVAELERRFGRSGLEEKAARSRVSD